MSGAPNLKIRDWVENLENRGRISFSLHKLQDENPDISETAIRSALSRLVQKGKVVLHSQRFLFDYHFRVCTQRNNTPCPIHR